MIDKLAILAIGGNSLIQDPTQPEINHQWQSVELAMATVAKLITRGWQIVITHGNGPQVGYGLRRVELAQHEVHSLPLDSIVAETQGNIGYMIQNALNDELRHLGINRTCATVITQIAVDAKDPAFTNPSKPIGGFMTESVAKSYEAQGWQVMEDAGRGWRRVVPSPKPHTIIEINAIQALMLSGYVVIACGGGGIPVIRTPTGGLQGIEAVIDKDLASSLLARVLRADLLLISTGVEQVLLDFKKPTQRAIHTMTIQEAEAYAEAGHFARGSMLPKIQAGIDFVRNGGPKAIITDPINLERALLGETGTHIIPQ
ncbi:MAG: carbamate kinase [Phototrophicales bacterium]|nr:carbamate kinase [Phototrophicales bacterium]